jgi:RAP domain
VRVLQANMAMVQVQTAMELTLLKNELSLPSNFPECWIENDATTAVMPYLQSKLNPSKLQKDVSKSLNDIGFDHVMEYTISMKDLADIYSINVPRKDLSIFSIDIANADSKIAIEVDGPLHYILRINNDFIRKHRQSGKTNNNNNNYEVNGSTMFKRRLLTMMGWKVLVVPYWEWNAVAGNEHKERQYCIDLLQQT